MEKRALTNFVLMPGCAGCSKVECKFNLPNATTWAVENSTPTPYGCNTSLFNYMKEEENGQRTEKRP